MHQFENLISGPPAIATAHIHSVEKYFRHAHTIISPQQSPEDSLLTGNLGLIVYHYCISQLGEEFSDHQLMAIERVEQLLDKIENVQSTLNSYHYSNGLAGLGAVLQFLVAEELLDMDMEEDFSVFDESIVENALVQINDGYAEFLHGGAGALHYLNKRPPSPRINEYSDRLVDALLNQAAHDPLGVRMPRGQFVWTANDDYDLSLSHGLNGVMHILLSTLLKGKTIHADRIRHWLFQSTTFMISLKREPRFHEGFFNYFPSYLPNKSTMELINTADQWSSNRLAWCYGDLGWTLFLYRYGRFTGNNQYTALANEIGLATTKLQTQDATNSSTAHFCHGHSGLAFIYQYLYRHTAIPEYKSASEFWLQQTLQTMDAELQNGFYKEKNNETSLLEGLPGINLVLSSFMTNAEPKWQQFFLFE